MRNIALFLCLFIVSLLTIHPSKSVNYEKLICDEEPDPELCHKITDWYYKTRQPLSQFGDVSCCGVADAYWADKVDKITPQGVFVTITDNRYIEGRYPRNGQPIFIPTDRLDDRFQGNPTGHNVVFIGTSYHYYLDDGVGWPAVYCAFLNFNE